MTHERCENKQVQYRPNVNHKKGAKPHKFQIVDCVKLPYRVKKDIQDSRNSGDSAVLIDCLQLISQQLKNRVLILHLGPENINDTNNNDGQSIVVRIAPLLSLVPAFPGIRRSVKQRLEDFASRLKSWFGNDC